jgi:hypothetical protein
MICKVAKAILCIPAQSASSERVFSRLSLVVDKKRTRLNKFFAAQLVKSSMRYTQKKSFEKTQKMSEHKRRNTFFKKFPPQGRCCITKDMFDQKVTEIEDAEDQFDGDFEPGDSEDEFDDDSDYDEESGDEKDMINYSAILGKTSSGQYFRLNATRRGNVDAPGNGDKSIMTTDDEDKMVSGDESEER